MGLKSYFHYIPLYLTHCRMRKRRKQKQKERKLPPQSSTLKTQINTYFLTWRSMVKTTTYWIRWITQGLLPWRRSYFWISNLTIIIIGNPNPRVSEITLCSRNLGKQGMMMVKKNTIIRNPEEILIMAGSVKTFDNLLVETDIFVILAVPFCVMWNAFNFVKIKKQRHKGTDQ